MLSDVRLDNDIVVSVFETNIRVLGWDWDRSICTIILLGFFSLAWRILLRVKGEVCVFSGLLGGHSMALMLKERGEHMQWYQDELLHMAKDLGLRLLPAFNTSSGLPYPRVRQNTEKHRSSVISHNKAAIKAKYPEATVLLILAYSWCCHYTFVIILA